MPKAVVFRRVWGSCFLPRALGALGVGILNAADDLAGGRLSIPKILDIIADDIRSHKSLQHLRKTAPETLVELYHYTSGEAARNILASGLIRGGRPGLWRPWAAGDVYFSVYPNAPKWLLQGVYGLPPTKTQVIVPARVPVRDVLWRPFGIRIVHGSIDITAGY